MSTQDAVIRLATSADAARIAEIYTPYILNTTITFEYDPVTTEEMERRRLALAGQFPFLVYEQAGRVEGYAYAARYHERAAYRYSATSSIYLSAGMRGRGVGSGLYRLLLDLLSELGYYNVYALLVVPNGPSEKLHARLGFEHVATIPKCGYKFGKWLDVAWYGKTLRPHDSKPAPIKTMAEAEQAVARILPCSTA